MDGSAQGRARCIICVAYGYTDLYPVSLFFQLGFTKVIVLNTSVWMLKIPKFRYLKLKLAIKPKMEMKLSKISKRNSVNCKTSTSA